MSKILALPFHVFDELNTLRARVHYPKDAAAMAFYLGNGAHVMTYHRSGATRLLWLQGKEAHHAVASSTILARSKMTQSEFAADWLARHDRGEV
jgi:hypothetical protein